MSRKLLRIRVTLKGRPVRSFAFNQDRVTIGRDPGADIFLDNAGISREHAAIEFTPSGTYILKDVGSANGIFVNDQPVKIHYIRENDVALIGKFSLWFVYDEDRRGEVSDARRLASTQDEGTTVLRASELQEMIEAAHAAPSPAMVATAAALDPGVATKSAPPRAASVPPRTRNLFVLGILLAFAAGFITGGGLRWLPWSDAVRPLAGVMPLDGR
jgi:predicted component of type VI protein secretion system